MKVVNFLGVVTDEAITWKFHIYNIKTKIPKTTDVFHKDQSALDNKALYYKG